MPLRHWKLTIMVLAALIAIIAVEARHPGFERLSSSDSHLSSSSKTAHTEAFMSGLSAYAQHLEESADVMMLQLESFIRHRDSSSNEHEADEAADGESEAEVESETENEAEANSESEAHVSGSMDADLENAFVSGNAEAVVKSLETSHHVLLATQQKATLVTEVQHTMEAVAHALNNGETIDRTLLKGGLDALFLGVESTMRVNPGKLPFHERAPDWIRGTLHEAVANLGNDQGELNQQLTAVAKNVVLNDPTLLAPPQSSVADLAQTALGDLDDTELEARIRFNARKKMWEDVVEKSKAMCRRKRTRGQKCDMNDFIGRVDKALTSIVAGKVPDRLKDVRDKPLGASEQLNIERGPTTTPEAVKDLEASIASGVDPWFDLPGRSQKGLEVKSKTVADLLDAEGDRCPKKCSLHGQCVMDVNRTVRSPSGSQNVHPFHCICDKGYVGNACQVKLDMHLRWLLTEGAAPFPKCCNVCEKQRNVPLLFDDIPAYNNPFSSFAPQCQPFPRISAYSREDGSHELIKGRRPDPKCSHPLGEITRTDPIVALELASDLSAAQQILQGSLLQNMEKFSVSAEAVQQLSAEAAASHMAQLKSGARALKEASKTAQKAALALAQKLHISDLSAVKYSSIDLNQLIDDMREMPNDMEECCLYCQLDKEEPPMFRSDDDAAQAGPNALLNKDPRTDNTVDALHRRMAQKRQDRRHAKLTGGVAKADQDCCVVCPYNLRELERLEEAAFVRKQSASDEDKEEMDKVFLETFAQVEGDRRRRHEPMPCCPGCPSQFLVAHAFPSGPYTTTRTLPNQGP